MLDWLSAFTVWYDRNEDRLDSSKYDSLRAGFKYGWHCAATEEQLNRGRPLTFPAISC